MSIEIIPTGAVLGAEIRGIDLAQPLDDATFAAIDRAYNEHGVIFFRGQDISLDQFWAFMQNFGLPQKEESTGTDDDRAEEVQTADMSPTRHATAVWHADTTSLDEPPMATALRAVQPTPYGGDTCWSSMYAAYEALSEPMRRMLDTLTAVHSRAPVLRRMGAMASEYKAATEKSGEHIHPVIRVHPETGRKALFVNEGWTTRIVELTPAESDHLLSLLFQHVKSPDFTMRWHWKANDLALWDNRCVQHYAVPDYSSERIMQRVMLAGDAPFGPMHACSPAKAAELETTG